MALENYTTYSEYDASGLVTVGANTLAVAGNNQTAFSVHKVFAAGHFSGDFEHVVAVALNNDGSPNYGWCPFWGLSNETAESAHSFKEIQEASGDCLYIAQGEGFGAVWISLFEISTGTQYSDIYAGASYDTWYYCEIERDESVGTYGTLLCRIYSDESRSTLVDTLSVALHKKEDFRTVYAVASYYPNSNRPYSQNIKNLDLQEAGTTHTVTGAITLPALEVSGTAQSSSGKVTHEVTGAIVLPALEVSGEATRFHSWEVTGAVTLPALEVDGQAEIAISLAGGGETDFQVYSSEDEDYVTGMALVDGGLLLNVDWKQRATEAECL